MENQAKFRPDQKLKLMDHILQVVRCHHYTYRTEQTYCQWIRRYIYFFGGQTHPRDLGVRDIERFLSDLAINGKVSISTQRKALNAIVFLYRQVLDIPIDGKIQPIRSKKKPNLPTVLSGEEIRQFFRHIEGTDGLMDGQTYMRFRTATHGMCSPPNQGHRF